MDTRKIYSYHSLTPFDILDSIDWARENYHRYEGETSPLWNEHVQREFVRLNELYAGDYYAEYEVSNDFNSEN